MTLLTKAFGRTFRQVAYVTNDFERALGFFAQSAGGTRFVHFRDLDARRARAVLVPLDLLERASTGRGQLFLPQVQPK